MRVSVIASLTHMYVCDYYRRTLSARICICARRTCASVLIAHACLSSSYICACFAPDTCVSGIVAHVRMCTLRQPPSRALLSHMSLSPGIGCEATFYGASRRRITDAYARREQTHMCDENRHTCATTIVIVWEVFGQGHSFQLVVLVLFHFALRRSFCGRVAVATCLFRVAVPLKLLSEPACKAAR